MLGISSSPITFGPTPRPFGKPAAVQHLLDKGADPQRPDNQGKTSLMWAVKYQQEPIWQILLQRGLALEAKDHDGRTALSYACKEVYSSAVHWLVDRGADVNVTDAQGNTPLLYAGDRGATEIVKFLKDRGAKPTDLHVIAKEMPSPPLSSSHRWALAVCALYVQWNGLNPNKLGNEETAERAKKVLWRDWQIHDQKTLEATIDRLRFVGARKKFQSQGMTWAALPNLVFWLLTLRDSKAHDELKAIRQNYQSWQGRSGLAGDLCRASYVINKGVACDYIDEEEAWRLLLPIARDTQEHFSSWHEMCDNYLDAREMWTGESDPALDACGDLLCNSKDPNSPWNEIPWNTDLSAP